MSGLAERILSRGYWQTLVRPREARPDRIAISSQLIERVRSVSVQLRGWDFPHVDFNAAPQIEAESIGQDTEWEHFHELWRIFRSGQFYHLAGMRYDWGAPHQLSAMESDPRGTPILGMGDTIYRFTEIAVFGSAYVRGILGGSVAEVTVKVGGLQGRRLVVDDSGRTVWAQTHTATTVKPYNATMLIEESTDRDTLLRYARKAALGLYGLFGREISETVLEDWQGKIGKW